MGHDARAQLRQLIRQAGGRSTFIRDEMIRLGFWSDEQDVRDAPQLKGVLAELGEETKALRKLDADIAYAQDIERMIEVIRAERIARVKAEREVHRRQRAEEQERRKQERRRQRQARPPWLGYDVSAGLRYDDGDDAKLAGDGLPRIADATELAAAVGVEPAEIAWLSYHRAAAAVDHYHRFTIPKRSGGTRTISSPKSRLRRAQRWVLASVLSPLKPHAAATAFRAGRSIRDNAVVHQSRDVVVRLDLTDFFPNITFPRVKGMFRQLGYNSGVSTILALLCTEAPRVTMTFNRETRYVGIGERQVPQGACTSPAITNILCRSLDRRLTGLATVHGFRYTRYADDLVFSGAQEKISEIGRIIGSTRHIVRKEGFRVNEGKTRIMRSHQRQVVTGVVVNGVPRVSRPDMRRFRAFLHGYRRLGPEQMSERMKRDATAYGRGYYRFVHMINADQAKQIAETDPWLCSSR